MKRIGLLIGGLSGFACALGFAILLLGYISGGSGLQLVGLPLPFFGEPVSSGSILIGLVHVVGLATASFLCFAVGAGFCAYGIVPQQASEQSQICEPNQRPTVEAAVGCGLHSDDASRGTTDSGR